MSGNSSINLAKTYILTTIENLYGANFKKTCEIENSLILYRLVNLYISNDSQSLLKSIGNYATSFKFFASLNLSPSEINEIIENNATELLFNFDATKMKNFRILKQIAGFLGIENNQLKENLIDCPMILGIEKLKEYIVLFHLLDLDKTLLSNNLKELKYFKRFPINDLYCYILYLLNDSEYSPTFANLKNITMLDQEKRLRILNTYKQTEGFIENLVKNYFIYLEKLKKKKNKEKN